eukprot:UN30404
MIECSLCREWYHSECVSHLSNINDDPYICIKCNKEAYHPTDSGKGKKRKYKNSAANSVKNNHKNKKVPL